MKKIICLLLALVMIVSIISCGDPENTNNGDDYQEDEAHVEHIAGDVTCSVCGLNYFNELRGIILESGNPPYSATPDYVTYEFTDGSKIYTFCAWTNDDDFIRIDVRYSWDSTGEGLSLYAYPDSIKYQEYKWGYTWDWTDPNSLKFKSISGNVDASTFSSITSALEISSYKNTTSSDASSKGSTAASLLLGILRDALPRVLQKSEYSISAKHFGFKRL